MLGAAFHGIDAGGVDRRMSENIRKADYVLVEGIKGAGKEMAQIVRKNLGA